MSEHENEDDTSVSWRGFRTIVLMAFAVLLISKARADANELAAPSHLSQQSKTHSFTEAVELSKTPQKQMVFHYDANMSEKYLTSIRAQAEALRHHGYFVVAVPGGPEKAVQVYINGLTSPKLKYDLEQIWKLEPTDFGASYYKKIIGPPQTKPIPP